MAFVKVALIQPARVLERVRERENECCKSTNPYRKCNGRLLTGITWTPFPDSVQWLAVSGWINHYLTCEQDGLVA